MKDSEIVHSAMTELIVRDSGFTVSETLVIFTGRSFDRVVIIRVGSSPTSYIYIPFTEVSVTCYSKYVFTFPTFNFGFPNMNSRKLVLLPVTNI